MTGEAVNTATMQKYAIELEQHECDTIMAALTATLIGSRDNEVCLEIMALQAKIRKVTGTDSFPNQGIVWVDQEFEKGRQNYRGP